MKNLFNWKVLFTALVGWPCVATELPQIQYLDEYLIPADTTYQGTTVGGLSSIDYVNGALYMISDHGGGKRNGILGGPRFYQAALDVRNNKFHRFNLKRVANLQPANTSMQGVDPESLRVLADSDVVVWSSEGSINQGLAPSITLAQMQKNGLATKAQFELPDHFDINDGYGPHHNAVFEGLSLDMSGDGVWVAMEGPLKQDGNEPTLTQGSFIRISYFGFASKKIEKQFGYYLDPLPHEPKSKQDAFRTTGVVELLQVAEDEFIVMERAYTSGLKDGGNRVKLFWVDASKATDTSKFDSLQKQAFVPAAKRQWLDLEQVRPQLKSKRIDNLEGLSFGPQLANGRRSLLLISDDNFNQFGPQLSQILLFELKGNGW